ncbi:hypothetical protein E2562_036015 [Oryza meyeriana var. granulata]|uniref:Uncharacterized protein n=1 Tax=Oryza meyeriana var. granulata TaxID=110450 RepID=A0A6G1CX46_9ORYZ|nr:hypothetical protein E2562_036015 [Oryza meyeriana var. granulata]
MLWTVECQVDQEYDYGIGCSISSEQELVKGHNIFSLVSPDQQQVLLGATLCIGHLDPGNFGSGFAVAS